MTKSNSKTPLVFRIGLALLCAMILSTHLMGNLYARYSTTAVGSDRARVAKFAGGTVEYAQYQRDFPHIDNMPSDYYAFAAHFCVNFEENEVASNYTLALSLQNSATFSPSQQQKYRTIQINADGTGKVAEAQPVSSIAGSIGDITNVNNPTYYCFFSTKEESDYEYVQCDDGSTENKIIIKKAAVAGAKHYYKVLVFYRLLSSEDFEINYSLTCEQVD